MVIYTETASEGNRSVKPSFYLVMLSMDMLLSPVLLHYTVVQYIWKTASSSSALYTFNILKHTFKLDTVLPADQFKTLITNYSAFGRNFWLSVIIFNAPQFYLCSVMFVGWHLLSVSIFMYPFCLFTLGLCLLVLLVITFLHIFCFFFLSFFFFFFF